MAHRRIVKLSVALGGTLILAGCSGWSYAPPLHGNYVVEPYNEAKDVAAAPPDSGTFVQETAYHYARYSQMLTHDTPASPAEWVDADYFARKGMVAEGGVTVPPEDNSNWAIPLEQPYGFRTKMAEERVRLVKDLDRGGRDRFPGVASRAQVAYDCWIERTEHDWAKEFDGLCHKDFVASMSALEQDLDGKPAPVAAAPTPPPAQHQYNVYFDFDKSALTPEGRHIVDQAVDNMKHDKGGKIVLVGKADLSGTDPYNMALSHRRADTVRSTVIADGGQGNQVEERWVGDREPPVPTAEGVREPRNRVVEINLN